MPRKLKQNGKRVPNVRCDKAWVELPTQVNPLGNTAIDYDSFLVPTRVADYIELLEKSIQGPLPMLPTKTLKL
tara:strand:+ start:212735 stop:212953 length:219 start_codon:yes stop_codon:yes gene_type:complete